MLVYMLIIISIGDVLFDLVYAPKLERLYRGYTFFIINNFQITVLRIAWMNPPCSLLVVIISVPWSSRGGAAVVTLLHLQCYWTTRRLGFLLSHQTRQSSLFPVSIQSTWKNKKIFRLSGCMLHSSMQYHNVPAVPYTVKCVASLNDVCIFNIYGTHYT